MTDPAEGDSILNSTKRALDIAIDDTSFDMVLLLHINTVFSDLYQIGLGAYGSDEIEILDASMTWATAFGSQKNLNMIKSYVALRVRLIFDPPAAGFTTTSMQNQIDKMEWRLKVGMSSAPNSDLVIPPDVPGPIAGEASIWDLTGLDDFPTEAPVGAVGVDLLTGIIWRKDS